MTTTKQYDYVNRLTSISSTGGSVSAGPVSFAYTYNPANQRVRSTLVDGSYWVYGYDSLGQVISGIKYWSDGTPVAGQQFDYTFDTIGNRTQTEAGGDQTGANLRLAHYTNNVLNQITSRDVPGDVDVMGLLLASNTVTVNSNTPYRRGEYFRDQLAVTNTSAAVWTNITVASPGQASVSGHAYVARTPETNTYDLDGNLLSDGRWTYSWDAENRLTNMTSLSGAPSGSQLNLSFVYDYMGRRIQKVVSTNNSGSYIGEYTNNYAYDGWDCVAILNSSLGLVNSFLWGTDLSGSMQGAGGVGGLVQVNYYGSSSTNAFPAYDGNGNVVALVNAADGSTLSLYEYGPFGELLRATGPMAKLNPLRFSTKYDDDESDFIYYGHRYYNPSTGRWVNRDLLKECGFRLSQIGDAMGDDDINPHNEGNTYQFVQNGPVSGIDAFGLWPSASPWYGRFLNSGFAIPLTHEDSDARALPLSSSDVAIVNAASVFVDDGQGTAQSYQHAMRAPGQSKAQARAMANNWVASNLAHAQKDYCSCDPGRHFGALYFFGMALHTVQDSTSPAHHGFQVWHGLTANPITWLEAEHHVAKEAWDPGSGSNLDKATAWLWSFMTCPPPPLPADFFIFNADWNWWYD
ncbi:MAG: RHS repeat-associated core domain-containing protein [Verrucomicrobiota bacterium]